MRNISISALAILSVAFLFSACSKEQTGELIGAQDRPKYSGINPYGMEYIPSATFHIGQADQDIFNSYMQRPLAVSIVGFFMDDTEITNNEYRQFVEWVRDSIAHTTKPLKCFFTHISHDTGLHEEINRILPEGIQLGYDGLKIKVG